MCGIAGFISPDAPETAERAVAAMVRSIRRRGPDGEGVESWPGVFLGHRRLAILDLSDAGRQPMVSLDHQIGVVFNGCIYNFLELRAELQKRGCVFRSNCDTEVLLHGYREWGIDELARRVRGMYAFAVWDEGKRCLTLVRDRLGVKPLVVATGLGFIAFASTVRALRAAGVTGDINGSAVLEFLEYGFVTEEDAIYDRVRKVPPATIIEWRDGAVHERQYWSLWDDPACSSRLSFQDAVDRAEEILLEAVRIRLHADVPIGALLSGGIDSTLVCWALAKVNAKVQAFTMAAPGDEYDEAEPSRETARILGIPHQVIALPDTSPVLLEEMTEAYSEPFAAQSALGLLLVSRAVKASATVLLTGDGGDDVFLGYPFMYNAFSAQRAAHAMPERVAAMWGHVRGSVPSIGPLRRLRSFLDYSTGGIGAHARAHNGLPWYEQRNLLGEKLTDLSFPPREVPPSFASARQLLTDVLSYHRRLHFTSEFMQKVDGATMYHALEARSPFLDHRLWEFAASLPVEIRFHGGQLKAVLREIVRRRVGPRVAARKKQGFSVPVERLLAGPWRGSLESLRDNGTVLVRNGWIAPGKLAEAVDEADRQGSAPVQLWYLLLLERWLAQNESAANSEINAGVSNCRSA